MSDYNNESLSAKVNINVNNLHLNNLNFGNTKISYEATDNKIKKLNGDFLKEKKYSFLRYVFNENSESELRLKFLDFWDFEKHRYI